MSSANNGWQIVIFWHCSPINLYNQKNLFFTTFFILLAMLFSSQYFILGKKKKNQAEAVLLVIVDWLLFAGSDLP